MWRHLLILGETGAGKTSLARHMIPFYRKVIVLDRHWEYGDDDGLEICQGYSTASQRITSEVDGSYRISYRADNDAEWSAAPVLAYGIEQMRTRSGQRKASDPPDLLIIVEEAGLFASPHKLPDWMKYLWNYGRHYGVTAVGICREDTEVHSQMRLNSTLVLFRTGEITSKVASRLGKGLIEKAHKLRLYSWGSERPQPGVHYITDPDAGDVIGALQGRQRIHIVA